MGQAVLFGDVAAAIGELKATPKAGLQVHGSGTLTRWLLENDFNDRLQAEGHWVFAGGLGAPSTATVIDNRGGEALFTDGPFVESKEYLAGFWIMDAPDLDVALKLAAEGSKACNRKVEVRPFL